MWGAFENRESKITLGSDLWPILYCYRNNAYVLINLLAVNDNKERIVEQVLGNHCKGEISIFKTMIKTDLITQNVPIFEVKHNFDASKFMANNMANVFLLILCMDYVGGVELNTQVCIVNIRVNRKKNS
ncbi:hypothetical protein WN51_07867 [Melipona quadrifasciata]|uniref:Uncharacterized protein n=1 Tax=Melipona quadrifasciata TaxID=166423 RepID=A0A0M9A6W3_9HYME|nr:hypothetical protein WN51_07867 [Melipona quadrifasciata]